MTTIRKREYECFVCGNRSTHSCIASTNAFGSPDLDTRPPEMERSTIYDSIQRCPSCGYCSYDISSGDQNTKSLVESQQYRDLLDDTSLPETAASFLALSYEKERLEEYSKAAWHAIRAAWICDDANDYESGRNCREKAVSLINQGNSNRQYIASQTGASEAITIDLMRRASMFTDAQELVDTAKSVEMEEIIRNVILFEERLINAEDIDVHTISEALDA